MFQATRNWFNRNRTRIAVSAGVVGGIYVAGQYALGKLVDARQRMSDDRIARENLRRRFTQNQEDCTYTVLALLPTAADNILNDLPVESITQELQTRKTEKLARSTASSEIAPSEIPSTVDGALTGAEGSVASSGFVHASQQISAVSDGVQGSTSDEGGSSTREKPSKSKIQLWDDLKIYSITRALTLIYTLALLTLLTRIQLNLLGRRNYLSSVVSLASSAQQSGGISMENRDDDNMEQDYGSDFDTNRKYLTFSWWLLHRGWRDVRNRVEQAVREVFGVLAPRDNITFGQLSGLILEVRKKIEGATEEERRAQRWLTFLLPPRAEEETVLRESGVVDEPPADATEGMISTSLRRLLDETSDLVDSPSFTHVLTLLLDSSFSLLVDDKLAVQAFKIPPQARKGARPDQELNDMLAGSTLLAGQPRIEELADDGINPLATQTSAKLATILAVMTRSAHVIGSGGSLDTLMSAAGAEYPGHGAPPPLKEANEYVAAMEAVRDLEAFAAVVYSSNFEFESIEAETERLAASAALKESYVDAGADDRFESVWNRASK